MFEKTLFVGLRSQQGPSWPYSLWMNSVTEQPRRAPIRVEGSRAPKHEPHLRRSSNINKNLKASEHGQGMF